MREFPTRQRLQRTRLRLNHLCKLRQFSAFAAPLGAQFRYGSSIVLFRSHVNRLSLACICVILFGCGGENNSSSRGGTGNSTTSTAQTGTAAGQKVFNYTNIEEPRKLDPAYTYDVYEGIINGLMYDGLVLFGEGSNVVPGLAEKWEISPDGKVYTFHLREAKFSNGKPVTSADVRYSFTRILRPETVSDRKWLFDKIVGSDEVTSGTAKELTGLETPDPKTVKITLKQAYPPFLTKLAMPNGVVIPENSAGAEKPDPAFDKAPIGSGPWVLDKWLRDQRLEFRRNEHFWGKKPNLDRFIYNVQLDSRVAQRQFEVGNFDIMDINFTIYSQWLRDPKKREQMIPVPELNTYYVGFMNSKPKFADKRVRQAIVQAINRKAIFENLQKGRGTLAHGSVPPGIEGYREGLKPREYDPELAKRLLAEAGAGNLEIDLWYRDEALGTEMMSAAQKDLEKVGIKVNAMRRDWPSVREAIYSGQADMFFNSWWLDYPDIENALEPSFHSRNIPRQGNGAHYSNPAFDAIIAQADGEADPKKRIELFQKAEDIIIEDCPWVPLFHRKSNVIVQPWVKNYKPYLMYNAGRYEEVDIDLSLKNK